MRTKILFLILLVVQLITTSGCATGGLTTAIDASKDIKNDFVLGDDPKIEHEFKREATGHKIKLYDSKYQAYESYGFPGLLKDSDKVLLVSIPKARTDIPAIFHETSISNYNKIEKIESSIFATTYNLRPYEHKKTIFPEGQAVADVFIFEHLEEYNRNNLLFARSGTQIKDWRSFSKFSVENNLDGSTSRKIASGFLAIGYIVTVPIDIALSPFYLIFLVSKIPL